ncbi:Hexokinase-1 [Cytospora mali]|uniref:Phosphotransferase n=1 Tax=Cytospora mali TaxID=578113 RepID=A0A194UU21_CYTMA|nr:Hexokinase-1 [Valsa mali var. pyri (nom. inval.)]
MATQQQRDPQSIEEFLKPLQIDDDTVFQLSRDFASTFTELSAKSENQFLPTPISESLLRHVNGADRGRYLAIDIGGSNLRVGFVELLVGVDDDGEANGNSAHGEHDSPRLHRCLERSWPIGEHLKNENADGLFSWIGQCVADVLGAACKASLHESADDWSVGVTPMGVTFSFPMVQRSVSEAMLLPMGKGFAITSNLDLGQQLLKGYEKHRERRRLPKIRIAAIANDAVATLVSFIYQFPAKQNQKAVMGLICGTGSNATIPMRLSSLHPSKRPETVSVIQGQTGDNVKIAVNTEWSINGSAPPLRRLGLISRWDTVLDKAGEMPGFQPLEYMTSGRYLGELGRLIFVDYLTSALGYGMAELPPKLKERFGLSTTFLSKFNTRDERKGTLLEQLEGEFPVWKHQENAQAQLEWTEKIAEALCRIAIAIEVRAAGIVAAATIGLLTCAEEMSPPRADNGEHLELVVGYTGGCISGFQNYLEDCQSFLDRIVKMEHGDDWPVRVILSPCHDGGITGAGILVPASLNSEKT